MTVKFGNSRDDEAHATVAKIFSHFARNVNCNESLFDFWTFKMKTIFLRALRHSPNNACNTDFDKIYSMLCDLV